MSIRALFSGMTGLQSQQVAMEVTGNNIANLNTIGYKASRATFQETFSQTLRNATGATPSRGGTNPVQVGLGTMLGSIDASFTQGILDTTGRMTDLAIQGGAFFILSESGASAQNYYTRAGAFTFDAEGKLVDSSTGLIVQGILADSTGQIIASSTIEDIVVDFSLPAPAQSTTTVDFAGNLSTDLTAAARMLTADSAFTVAGSPATTATDLNTLDQVTVALDAGDVIAIGGTNSDGSDVTATYTYVVGDTVQTLLNAISTAFTGATATLNSDGEIVLTDDTTGTSLTNISLTFQDQGVASAMNLPNFNVMVEGKDAGTTYGSIAAYDSLGDSHLVTIAFTGTDIPGQYTFQTSLSGTETVISGDSGTVTFTADGSLATFDLGGGATSFVFNPNNGANAVTIGFDPGTVGSYDGLTAMGLPSSVLCGQDGYGAGTLQSTFIDDQGIVQGVFSNGVTRPFAQINLAHFDNPNGLLKAGNSTYLVSPNSGDPVIGTAGNEINATIRAGALEMSNVDLTREFTNLVIAQRAFQANARVMSASSELLEVAANLLQ